MLKNIYEYNWHSKQLLVLQCTDGCYLSDLCSIRNSIRSELFFSVHNCAKVARACATTLTRIIKKLPSSKQNFSINLPQFYIYYASSLHILNKYFWPTQPKKKCMRMILMNLTPISPPVTFKCDALVLLGYFLNFYH